MVKSTVRLKIQPAKQEKKSLPTIHVKGDQYLEYIPPKLNHPVNKYASELNIWFSEEEKPMASRCLKKFHNS